EKVDERGRVEFVDQRPDERRQRVALGLAELALVDVHVMDPLGRKRRKLLEQLLCDIGLEKIVQDDVWERIGVGVPLAQTGQVRQPAIIGNERLRGRRHLLAPRSISTVNKAVPDSQANPRAGAPASVPVAARSAAARTSSRSRQLPSGMRDRTTHWLTVRRAPRAYPARRPGLHLPEGARSILFAIENIDHPV